MKSLLQCGIALFLIGAAAGFTLRGDVEWRTLAAPQTWNVFGNYVEMNRERDRTQHLNEAHEAAFARMACNDRITREVREGRLGLRAAAAEFQQTNRDFACLWDVYAEGRPGWSKTKLSAVGVIQGVEQQMLDQGEDATETVATLYAELEEWGDD